MMLSHLCVFLTVFCLCCLLFAVDSSKASVDSSVPVASSSSSAASDSPLPTINIDSTLDDPHSSLASPLDDSNNFDVDYSQLFEQMDFSHTDFQNFDEHPQDHVHDHDPHEYHTNVELHCDQLFTQHQLCHSLIEQPDSFAFNNTLIHFTRYSNNDKSLNSQLAPIIVLSQAGYDSQYMLTLRQLACDTDHSVIFYDRASTGLSNNPPTEDEEFKPLSIELLDANSDYYVRELQALIDHLQLKHVHLLAHQFGSLIAQRYAASKQGQDCVLSLVLISGWSDSQHYKQEMLKRFQSTLPPITYKLLTHQTLDNSTDFTHSTELYRHTVDLLLSHHLTRTMPLPSCVYDSFVQLNHQVFESLMGENEFDITGSVLNVNLNDELPSIRSRETLLVIGQYDLATRQVADSMQKRIANSRVIEMPHSGSFVFIDDVDLLIEAVRDMLVRVEPHNASVKDEL